MGEWEKDSSKFKIKAVVDQEMHVKENSLKKLHDKV
jgi:hypothetical protein